VCSQGSSLLTASAVLTLCSGGYLVICLLAADACQSEMSRAVRFALWDYQEGQGLTAVCDADVGTFCPKVRHWFSH
jgi:hypothetical protein